MKTRTAQLSITVAALLLAALHALLPDFKLDNTTLILLVVAVMPWLLQIVKSVELPGGFKIELQELKVADKKLTKSAANMRGRANGNSVVTGRLTTVAADSVETVQAIVDRDPGLAMVGLRIELEQRLRRLAAQKGLRHEGQSLYWLLHEMRRKGILQDQFTEGLSDLIRLGNRAAHGAQVSPDAGEWLLHNAPGILEAVDELLKDNAKAS